MTTHLHVTASFSLDRAAYFEDLLGTPRVVRCHRGLRGPYTGVDEVLSALLPDAKKRWPDLVDAHRVELLYGMPGLVEILGKQPQTLASESAFTERTRFFGAGMIRCMSQGIVTFLRECARRNLSEGGSNAPLVFDGVQEADPTTQEFLAILLRRLDPGLQQVCIGSNGQLSVRLADALTNVAIHRAIAASSAEAPPPPEQARSQSELTQAFVDSDGTSEDPAELAAYHALDTESRAALHDTRAAKLRGSASVDTWMALAFHCEHGSQPGTAGRDALLSAQRLCAATGFSSAVVELGYRGRRITDPTTDSEIYSELTEQAAAALVPLGRLDESMALYREIRRVSTAAKRHMSVSYDIAMMHTRFLEPRDHEQAVEWENNAIAIAGILPDPRDRLVYGVFQSNAMALIQMHRGKLREALDLIEAGIAALDAGLGPDEWVLHRSQLHYNRARLLTALGRHDEACDIFTDLIQLDPYYTDYLSERAKIHRRRGDLAAALADYDRAVELAPPFPELFYNRGTAYQQLGDIGKAEADYRYVLDMEPTDADTRIALVELYQQVGDDVAALTALEHGLDVSPDQPMLLCMRAEFCLEQSDSLAALNLLNRSLSTDPKYLAALVNRAVAHYQLGHFTDSATDLTTAISLSRDDDPDLFYNRGLAYLGADKLNAAISDFDRALGLGPSDEAELLLHRAKCLLKAGRQFDAECDLRRCLEMDGDQDEARALLETAVC